MGLAGERAALAMSIDEHEAIAAGVSDSYAAACIPDDALVISRTKIAPASGMPG